MGRTVPLSHSVGWGLNKIMNGKCLVWCLAHGRYSVNTMIDVAVTCLSFSWKGLSYTSYTWSRAHVMAMASPGMVAELNWVPHDADGGGG